MTTEKKIARPVGPATPAMREGAARLVAAGNAIEAVAAVFGVSTDSLRDVLTQPADWPASRATVPVPGPVPVPAWHHFPGTTFYPCPNYPLVWLMCFLFLFTGGMAWMLHAVTWQPLRGVFLFLAVATVPTALGAVQFYRAARVAGFEMRPDAVAKYALSGWTVCLTGTSPACRRAGREQAIGTFNCSRAMEWA